MNNTYVSPFIFIYLMASKKKTERKRSNEMKKKQTNNKTPLIAIIVLIGIIVIAAGVYLIMNQPSDDGTTDGNTNDSTENPIAVIDTSKGLIKVELYQDKAPKTVENFVKLVNDGFYDGMIFHRVMDDFMIQAGNTYPDGTTKESPYGNIAFESDPDLTHEDGSISMASTGAGVGGSAQFFICDGAQSGLDGSYAVFGKTISGIDVVRDIADEPQDGSYGSVGGGRPIEDVVINSITIE